MKPTRLSTSLIHPLLALGLLAGLGPTAPPLLGEEATLSAVRDNTLYEDPDGNLSNGAGDYFFTGTTEEGLIRRGLIAFDVAGTIPTGSVISNATLTLYMSRTKSREEDVSLHRVLLSWGEGGSDAEGEEGKGAEAQEGDATWQHQSYPSDLWPTDGGDFASEASATTGVNRNGSYAWSSSQMAADVQGWVDEPGTDHGWLVKGNEAAAKTAKRFNTRTFFDPSQQPRLVVTFRPPASTGACCFTNGDCLILTSVECSALGGEYQGDGTSCTPNPCPQPPATGACCFEDGSCEILTQVECSAQGGLYQGDDVPCGPDRCPLVLEPFVDELPVPGALEPIEGVVGGEARYLVSMTQFLQPLHRDLPPTVVWGYGGSFPGPTIEATRDLPVSVVWSNDLRDPAGDFLTEHYLPVDFCLHGPDHEGPNPRTVVHLHGGHVPPEADGYPEDTFLPGESAEYFYPNKQPAATLWYHDHALGITRLNVYMGMAGFYLLRDSTEAALGLPSGEYEVPLALQDRRLHPDGSLAYAVDWQDHFFGDKMVVNGKVWPYFNVQQGKYRLRLLNGCNSRVLLLGFSPRSTFQQIGTDSGLLPAPVSLDEVLLAPGERADVVVDFSAYAAGSQVLLTNGAPTPYPGEPGVGVITNVMKFVVQDGAGHLDELPASLAPSPSLQESNAVVSRDFVLRKEDDPCTGQRWTINGGLWDEITEYPVLGTTEVWNWINRSGVVHPMHMHLVLFQVLDRQAFVIENDEVVPSGPRILPPPNERGWKDTVRADPNQITRVIARFDDYTGTYPYHCHILEHEDHEMMRQFTVVDAPRFTGIRRTGDDVELELLPVPTWQHHVQSSLSLTASFWMVLTNMAPASTGSITIVDPGAAAASPERYYRLRVVP